eukprot:scaffold323185_cov19-Tisochrysis_lutea.AAC.1
MRGAVMAAEAAAAGTIDAEDPTAVVDVSVGCVCEIWMFGCASKHAYGCVRELGSLVGFSLFDMQARRSHVLCIKAFRIIGMGCACCSDAAA